VETAKYKKIFPFIINISEYIKKELKKLPKFSCLLAAGRTSEVYFNQPACCWQV